MNRCETNCVSTGKRCKNNAVHHGHCGLHSRVNMRFKDESGEQIDNTTEELKRVVGVYLRKLKIAIDKVDQMEGEPHRRINQRFKALRNKYFIGDFTPSLIANSKFLKGNDAVRFISNRFHITPGRLMQLCHEIPHIEEITIIQIMYLLSAHFGKDALRMFAEEGVVV
jgi:hypothetical protein